MFYAELFAALERNEIRYLLVGGLAMNLHGVPRATMDIDLILALDPANVASFLTLSRELGMSPLLPVRLDELADPQIRTRWIAEKGMIAFPLRGPRPQDPTVDVLIAAPIDFDRAYARRVSRPAFGCSVEVAGVEDMIALKSASGRRQDLADIEHLRRLS